MIETLAAILNDIDHTDTLILTIVFGLTFAATLAPLQELL